MGSFSLMHWVIVLIIIVLLFGGGRISSIMGDVAKGIKSFKKGISEEDESEKQTASNAQPTVTKTVDHKADEVK